MTRLRDYRSAKWDEPLVMELGREGRRGMLFPQPVEPADASAIPAAMRRESAPELPELSEFEVQRHYLHLSQMVLGMMHVNLFGTCTMKYNPRLSEELVARSQIAQTHPLQAPETLQGTLAIIHGLDRILRELSGMDQFVFQAGGGADAAYTNACVTRAYHASRGELAQRTEVITSIQAHPCNAATAAAAGFDVITLPLEEHGYPSLAALKAAVSERTAALMIGNPDDMGIYNPEITEWVDAVHAVGGLCFYDHANFNGVMSKIRARELGFDACMFMLHKTFGAPKGGGGPATGAYGCSAALAPFLPGPVVTEANGVYALDARTGGVGKVREFLGNVPVIVKAYAWARAMGAEGIREASDISVIANNYMEDRLLAIRGVTKSHPQIGARRMEMTRYSLGTLTEETGVTVMQIANRMVDFGVDAPWLSHEPWVVPEPFTPEPGELWSKEDIDYWIDVLAHVCEECYADPETVRTAPHNHAIRQLDYTGANDPGVWATTWRAYRRKHAAGVA
jgi:glycine dehydrogenase subunit 2